MNECKHRWEEKSWGKAGLAEGRVIYHCARCLQTRLVQLGSKQ